MWRHDAGRTGVSPEELPDDLHLQWVRKYPPLKPAYWQVRQGRLQFDLGYEPVVMGNDQMEATWGPIYGFPLTYLVDHEWRIRKRWIGAVPDKSEQLRHLIGILLDEREAAAQDTTDD